MKNCMQCGSPAPDEVKFCGECGLQFSFVGQPETPEAIEAPTEVAQEANGWIKIGAVCLVLLTGMFGCQQYNESRMASCRSQAMQASSIVAVLDVRTNFVGACEYLMKHRGIEDDAEWQPQYIFDIYLPKAESVDAPNK
jgi:hypothetical protein